MKNDLAERFHVWAKEAMSRVKGSLNEEQTKFTLIVPFFEQLGYRSSNIDVVIPEARAGSPDGSRGRADLVIRVEGTPGIVVECKRLGALRGAHAEQLAAYFSSLSEAHVGVLTDGHKYHFFGRAADARKTFECPLVSLSLEVIAERGLNEEAVKFLEAIRADDFDVDAIADCMKRSEIERAVKEWWLNQIRDPSDELCHLVLRQHDFSRITDKLIATYRDVVANSLMRSMALQVRDILANGVAGSNGTFHLPDKALRSTVITTERERRFFHKCCTSLAQSEIGLRDPGLIDAIEYKDYYSHFSIFLGGVRNGLIVKYFENGVEGEEYEFPGGVKATQADFDRRLREQFEIAARWYRGRNPAGA